MSSSPSSTTSHQAISPSLSNSTIPTSITSLVPTELPVSAYGSYVVRDVVRKMKDSPSWIGNPERIANNFEWVEDPTSRSIVLKWKEDAPDRLDDDDDGEACITWFGVVTASGSVLGADGEFNAKWEASGMSRHKRVVRVTQPSSKLTALKSLWECQLAGAKSLVDAACRTKSGHTTPYKYCFFDKDEGTLRARSPLFIKLNHDDEDSATAIPEHMTYPSWRVDSPKVKMMLDNVIAEGFSPHIMEAYDENDNLIHPNEVRAKLCGSLVTVACTFQKMLFTGKDQPGGRAWQIYANLVKVKIIEPFLAGAGTSPAKKRRLASDFYPEHSKRSKLDDKD